MTTELTTDENGDTMIVKRIHKGRFIPPSFAASGTERMHETPLRRDDILLCSYPKAGCHWLYENLRFIVSGQIKVDDIEKDDYQMDQHEFGSFDHLPSPRILNNHSFFDDQPSDLRHGIGKLIFAYRNPKDTAVSFYHHIFSSPSLQYNGKFSAFLKLFAAGKIPYNYFEYMRSWDQGLRTHPDIPCLFVRYEDMVRKPLSERRRIAEFVGKQRDDKFLQSVAEATTMDKMKVNKEKKTLKGKDGSYVMYRQGKIGDWKDHFTVNENEWYTDLIREKLGHSEFFEFIYE